MVVVAVVLHCIPPRMASGNKSQRAIRPLWFLASYVHKECAAIAYEITKRQNTFTQGNSKKKKIRQVYTFSIICAATGYVMCAGNFIYTKSSNKAIYFLGTFVWWRWWWWWLPQISCSRSGFCTKRISGLLLRLVRHRKLQIGVAAAIRPIFNKCGYQICLNGGMERIRGGTWPEG